MEIAQGMSRIIRHCRKGDREDKNRTARTPHTVQNIVPKTSSHGQMFRSQDIKKKREGRKTKADRRKKNKLGNMKTPALLVGF